MLCTIGRLPSNYRANSEAFLPRDKSDTSSSTTLQVKYRDYTEVIRHGSDLGLFRTEGMATLTMNSILYFKMMQMIL